MPIPVSWSWVQIPRSVFIFFDFSPPILSNGVMRDKKCGTFHDSVLHPCARAILLFSVSFNFSLCTAKASKIVLAKFSVLFLMMWSDFNQNMNTHSAWGANPGPLFWKSISISSALLILLHLRGQQEPISMPVQTSWSWVRIPR